MRGLHHRLYIEFAVLALLLALARPAQAQDVAARMSMIEYMVQERPVLANLVTKAGLTPILSDVGPYTILAPPEAELEKLKDLPAVRLRAVLSGHILHGLYQEKDFKDGATIQTLAHTNIKVCRKKDYTLIDGVQLGREPVQVKNGILHSLSGKLNL